MSLLLSTLVLAILIALVHIFGHCVEQLHLGNQRFWLSVSAGATVAFVFMMLIPELEHLRALWESNGRGGLFDDLVHLMTFLGVTIFYGLETLAHRVRHPDEQPSDSPGGDLSHDYLFWLHIGWYLIYNSMVGALLLYTPHQSLAELSLFGIAMGIHLLIVDANLRHHHRHIYQKTGRWLLAMAIIIGWALGAYAPLPMEAIILTTAFLIGGIFINGIKDELPPSRQTRFLPFFGGGVVFSVLAILL